MALKSDFDHDSDTIEVLFKLFPDKAIGSDDDDSSVDYETSPEWFKYCEEVNNSDGYDVSKCKKFLGFGAVQPYTGPEDDYESIYKEIADYAKLGLSEFNKQNGTNYAFVKVIKSNKAPCASAYFYITFEAKNPDDSVVKTLQTTIYEDILDRPPTFYECRIKPGT